MFKKYKIETDRVDLSFFVHSRRIPSGFEHEAVCLGSIPDAPGKSIDGVFEKQHKERFWRVGYVNRTWESYSGQSVLRELWNRLSKSKVFDASVFSGENPFESSTEPEHQDLLDPEDTFGDFRRGRRR